MANHKSSMKRIRQNEKRRAQNSKARAAVRTAIKKTRAAAAAGEKEKARELFSEAEQVIQKASKKGLYHPKNASRKVSRLASLVQS